MALTVSRLGVFLSFLNEIEWKFLRDLKKLKIAEIQAFKESFWHFFAVLTNMHIWLGITYVEQLMRINELDLVQTPEQSLTKELADEENSNKKEKIDKRKETRFFFVGKVFILKNLSSVVIGHLLITQE